MRIGEVQWGDSGVYICKVIISDDLEGQNEASVELLVLGKVTLLSQHAYCADLFPVLVQALADSSLLNFDLQIYMTHQFKQCVIESLILVVSNQLVDVIRLHAAVSLTSTVQCKLCVINHKIN